MKKGFLVADALNLHATSSNKFWFKSDITYALFIFEDPTTFDDGFAKVFRKALVLADAFVQLSTWSGAQAKHTALSIVLADACLHGWFRWFSLNIQTRCKW